MNTPIRLAYLVSQYPAANHTFILREIRALRGCGFDVDVISIRAADRPSEKLSPVEKEEQGRTWVVLTAGTGAILAAHASTFLRRPLPYLRGLTHAVGLARGDLRKIYANIAYFAEAVVAGARMNSLGLGHLHSHFTSTVALLLTRVFPVSMSVTIHGPDEFNDVLGFYLAEKVARSRFISAISSYARSQLMKASSPEFWNKIEVVPLGVDSSIFAPRPHRSNPARFEILCVGRLAPAKAQHLLVEAVDHLVREGRNIHLRLVGDGPDRATLEKSIAALSASIINVLSQT